MRKPITLSKRVSYENVKSKRPQLAGAVRVRNGSGPATKKARWHYDATSMQGSSMILVRRVLTMTSLRVRKNGTSSLEPRELQIFISKNRHFAGAVRNRYGSGPANEKNRNWHGNTCVEKHEAMSRNRTTSIMTLTEARKSQTALSNRERGFGLSCEVEDSIARRLRSNFPSAPLALNCYVSGHFEMKLQGSEYSNYCSGTKSTSATTLVRTEGSRAA